MVSQFGAHTYSAGPRPDNDQFTKFKRLQRTERSYTLNDSLLDDVAVASNLLRKLDQRAPLDLTVSSRNQRNLLPKNQLKSVLTIRRNTSSDT